MIVDKRVSAGVYSKSDLCVTLEPCDELQIEIISSVKSLYGDDIQSRVEAALKENEIDACHVLVEDKGALGWVIDARLYAAIERLREA